jgi:prepilin-type N-terminal cleavage/methylation domain-containing protein
MVRWQTTPADLKSEPIGSLSGGPNNVVANDHIIFPLHRRPPSGLTAGVERGRIAGVTSKEHAMKRSGFTLIELLVVMVIMVTLTALAVGALRKTAGDRVNEAARLVQSKVMLAKNSATSDRAVRGIRFERDGNDPRICRSVMLIGSAGQHEEGLTDIRSITDGDPSTTGDDYWQLSGSFNRLYQRRLISVGTHVQIPSGSGVWYVLSDREFDPANGHLSIAGHYHNSVWGDDSTTAQNGEYLIKHRRKTVAPFDLAESVSFQIELEPTVLNGDAPLVLPMGTAIDIDASQVPADWRVTANHCDLLFDSSGSLQKSAGLVHLYVTRLQDIELTRNLFPDHPAIGGSRAVPIVPSNQPGVPAEAPYVITVLPNTGMCYSSDVDFTDSDGDMQADDPFAFARRGNERNQ